MNKINEYYQCPYCGNNYKGKIPKGGDGSMLVFPVHKRRNLFADNRFSERKEVCPGSNRDVEEAKP